VKLSDLLRKLSACPAELQDEEYRSPHSVHLKVRQLRAIQTEGADGVVGDGRPEAALWREFAGNPTSLQDEAEAIRAQLREGIVRPAQSEPAAEDVDIEQQHTETYMVTPTGEPRLAERAEQQLVLRYRDYMAAKGVRVCRGRYWPAGEGKPIFSDAWIPDRHALIEAKNSDSRTDLRQAIGQLYDYRRFHQPSTRIAVLLPHPPGPERLDLLRSAGIGAIWPSGPAFCDSADGAFT
jgi:hypothetical protein